MAFDQRSHRLRLVGTAIALTTAILLDSAAIGQEAGGDVVFAIESSGLKLEQMDALGSSRRYHGQVGLAPSMGLASASQSQESGSTTLDLNVAGTVDALDEEGILTPLDIRELSLDVKAVDISLDSIGTLEFPESAKKTSGETVVLPDGYSKGASYKPVHWRASLIAHHPLIFEDAMLERHGHARWGCVQPFLSGTKFLGSIAFHPYLNTLSPPWECQYSLGQYRPGTCAPTLRDHLPWDRRAITAQTLAMGSFFWAAPLY